MTEMPNQPDRAGSGLQLARQQHPGGVRFGNIGLVVLTCMVLALELAATSFIYKHGIDHDCYQMGPIWTCMLLSSVVLRGVSLGGACALFLAASPAVRQALGAALRPEPARHWILVHLTGFAVILLPLLWLEAGIPAPLFLLAILCWLTGAGLVASGAALALIKPRPALAALGQAGWILPLVLLCALLTPEFGAAMQWLWYWPFITEVTFNAVEAMLLALGEPVYANPETAVMGIGEFLVRVERECSGVEGFALITAFLCIYIALFRDQLHLSRVWLLLPLGILVSWIFNVTRIAVLIQIGAHISPDLAINSFHSHAGWLMFTILSVSFAALMHSVPWFRTAPAVEVVRQHQRPAFFADPAVARIFPFLVFMASALLASTFSETPAIFYPLRALAMATALVLVWRVLAELDWRIDPLAVGAGTGIGVLWLATAPAAAEADTALTAALAAMPAWLFVVWAISRVVGTAVLVPMIEELFFRGYVQDRLDRGGLLWRLVALGVSAGLFAMLHDRWLAAGLSGLVFGLLYLRRGQLADAVYAHAAANAVIAGWAVAQGDWSVI